MGRRFTQARSAKTDRARCGRAAKAGLSARCPADSVASSAFSGKEVLGSKASGAFSDKEALGSKASRAFVRKETHGQQYFSSVCSQRGTWQRGCAGSVQPKTRREACPARNGHSRPGLLSLGGRWGFGWGRRTGRQTAGFFLAIFVTIWICDVFEDDSVFCGFFGRTARRIFGQKHLGDN